MLGMPAPTPFDLNFRLLGIPVRVSPWFWLLSVFISPVKESGQVVPMVVWIACVFVSILVHEFGHGLTARLFGYRAEIALYGMGGLCASEADRQTFWQRLAVLIMGPGAGFLLFGLALAAENAAISLRWNVTPAVGYSILFLQIINLWWGILNLLPLWPLDGGQILGTLLGRANARHGRRWTHIVGMVGAGCLGAWLISINQIYNSIICFLLAFMNYQMLQAIHQSLRSSYDYGEDDADWWKR